MCVMSMIMEVKAEEWRKRYWPGLPMPSLPPLPTMNEVEEFRRLLDRAREYDRTHNHPDCEMEDKRQLLRQMAKKLGVEIDFV